MFFYLGVICLIIGGCYYCDREYDITENVLSFVHLNTIGDPINDLDELLSIKKREQDDVVVEIQQLECRNGDRSIEKSKTDKVLDSTIDSDSDTNSKSWEIV
jgi:hypothetical protein